MRKGALKCLITNLRKRKINAIAETVTRVKSSEVEKKENTKIALGLHFIPHFLSR